MMKSVKFTFCLLFVFAANGKAQQAPALIDRFCNTEFTLSFETNDIPKAFITYYRSLQIKYYGKRHAGRFDIAGPGKPFNSFDFGDGLPNRRLIFNGRAKNLYFIYFEKGGIGQDQQYLYIMELEDNKVATFLACATDTMATTLEQLKVAIKENHYHIIQ